MATVNREELIRDNRRISIQIEQMANSSMAEQDLTAMQANMLRYILRHSDTGTSLTAIHQAAIAAASPTCSFSFCAYTRL